MSGGFRKGSALDSATRRSYLFNVPTQEPEQDIEEDKSSIQTEIHYIEPGRDYEPQYISEMLKEDLGNI